MGANPGRRPAAAPRFAELTEASPNPAKLRKDGIRLGLVSVVSLVYAFVLDHAVLNALLIGLNGFGVLVAMLALAIAGTAIRQGGADRLCRLRRVLLGHVVAIVAVLGN